MSIAIPEHLHDDVEQIWQEFEQIIAQAGIAFAPHQQFKSVLLRVWYCSRFVSNYCLNYPQEFVDLCQSGDLNRDYRPVQYRHSLDALLHKVKDEEAMMRVLRTFRQREMIRIAWRDLADWAQTTETLRDLSLLADACIDCSLARLHAWACKKWGVPRTAAGIEQQLVVLGMGKLGAYELNFSSDIDLIFAYAEEGHTRKRKGISCEEFFTAIGRQLINVLDSSTDNGFVFRVDMRLRPYGESGGLAVSFEAMEEYYQYQGREWERYAMIKARVVAGDFVAGAQLLKNLRPFTYRRYLDYSAFESLRNMKAMIARQVQRKGMQDNIKLGAGGIREIEFIGQAFQLIRGGREPQLQVRGITWVLQCLSEMDYLPDYVTVQLLEAYDFLRRAENRLQAYADQQTHMLPTMTDDQQRLAVAMGFADWDSFAKVLGRHRSVVNDTFEQVMAAPQASRESNGNDDHLSALWMGVLDDDQAEKVLAQLGYEDISYALGLIKGLREGHAYRSRSSTGQERMDRLMPLVLGAVSNVAGPDQCLLRVINLMEAISGRSTYLSLLVEHPLALSQLVKLFAQSAWISEHLILYPVLLDQLLDPRSLYEPLRKSGLERELESLLQQVEEDDLEQQMEVLRYFKQSNTLQVAAADIFDVMSLVKVSDHLTEQAEVILEQTLKICQQNLGRKFGQPVCGKAKSKRQPGFIVIGYGKLGGIELGYGSDLDLVFLHDSDEKGKTTGPKKIDNRMFFARLGQRMIHMLNTRTGSGMLYEVDMRLRPSGASGLLVSDLESFADYQREQAWTWEHQALVRARAVAGDPGLMASFNEIRREVLCSPRDAQKLQAEVTDMRERMRSEMGSKRADRFHLKQDAGGMADIEFIVQYLVLRYAHKFPQLIDYSDNLRQLEILGELELITIDEASALFNAYSAYRIRGHHHVLTDKPSWVGVDEFVDSRKLVIAMWKRLMLEPVV